MTDKEVIEVDEAGYAVIPEDFPEPVVEAEDPFGDAWGEPMPAPDVRAWRAMPQARVVNWHEGVAGIVAGQWAEVRPAEPVFQPMPMMPLWEKYKPIKREDEVNYADITQFILDEVGVGVQNLNLFGSRRFYGAVEGSDWDVAVQWSDELTRKLYDAGWFGKEPYPDDNTIQVFEKKFKDTKVQLVLVADIKVHRDIWNSMSNWFWKMFINKRGDNYLGKDGVREYFNTMCRVHKSARQYDLEELV